MVANLLTVFATLLRQSYQMTTLHVALSIQTRYALDHFAAPKLGIAAIQPIIVTRDASPTLVAALLVQMHLRTRRHVGQILAMLYATMYVLCSLVFV
jgi:hypothetical protein